MARTFHTFDLIIIGAGSAGLAALKEARRYTDNVLLIHKGPTGTTCARLGCMPSKSLIYAAKLYDSHKRMPEAGITGSELLSPDIPAIMQTVRDKRDAFVASVREETSIYDGYIIQGTARFESSTTIRANGNLFHTKASIIATGSTPFIPKKYQDFSPYLITSDSLFECKDLPKRIAVIGLGAIGLEMAQAFAMLGIEVTAVNRGKTIGMVKDPKINSRILETLYEDMNVWLDSDPGITRIKSGLILHTNTKETVVDAIFVATGRTPNTSRLGLRRLGIDTNGNGVPPFNRYNMQISGYPIYMAGDVTDERAILHEASDEGRRAAYHALHENAQASPRYPQLQIIFTKPTIAIVGDTSYALRHDTIVIGESDFEDQGRAKIEDSNFGKISLLVDKEGGYLRGAEIMAPAAEHLAHFLALALTQRLTVRQILKTPFYHPTLEEGLRSALIDAAKKVKLV